jgi:outer membrane biosynthesis protein TonB
MFCDDRPHPMDRKAQLMDFLDRPQGNGDYRRGGSRGRGRGGGRGRGRGYPADQDNSRRAYNNYREQGSSQYRGNNRQTPPQNQGASGRYSGSPQDAPSPPNQQYSRSQDHRESPQAAQQPATQPPPQQAPPPQEQEPAKATPPQPQQQQQQERPQQQQQASAPSAPQPPAPAPLPQRGGGPGARGRHKSITPDRIPPKKNIEGVMECAPPLTVVETRTAYTLSNARGGGAGGDGPRHQGGDHMHPPPQHQRKHQAHGNLIYVFVTLKLVHEPVSHFMKVFNSS